VSVLLLCAARAGGRFHLWCAPVAGTPV